MLRGLYLGICACRPLHRPPNLEPTECAEQWGPPVCPARHQRRSDLQTAPPQAQPAAPAAPLPAVAAAAAAWLLRRGRAAAAAARRPRQLWARPLLPPPAPPHLPPHLSPRSTPRLQQQEMWSVDSAAEQSSRKAHSYSIAKAPGCRAAAIDPACPPVPRCLAQRWTPDAFSHPKSPNPAAAASAKQHNAHLRCGGAPPRLPPPLESAQRCLVGGEGRSDAGEGGGA